MRLLVLCGVYVLLLVLLAVSNAGVSASKDLNKKPRTSVFYLRPSRRIGRSETSWNDNQATSKRKISKLMAFPRVGRGNSRSWLQEGDFEAPSKRNQGMWFGPRLGRVQKRDALLDGSGIPQTYIILGGEELLPRGIDYTPRLGRESEETNEEVGNDLGGPMLMDSP